jgi:diaminohydroxyphosphoribosylaminopyrimidine deaminase / 5-amino-6-(5-phosphoribosylamino)uracil reductase
MHQEDIGENYLISDEDKKFMKKALLLAKKAEGLTSPNPLVGAVIVKNSMIISKGYHKKAGKEHAEVLALENLNTGKKDLTLYVNLEPCSHFGV